MATFIASRKEPATLSFVSVTVNVAISVVLSDGSERGKVCGCCTGERTLADYLLAPVLDSFARAFREE